MQNRNGKFILATITLFALLLVQPAGLLPSEKPAAKPCARRLLYPATMDQVPASLRPFVRKLLALDQCPVEPSAVKPAGVFVRVVTRKHVLEGEQLKAGGTLGINPFVFVALPESLYGRSLLQVFSVIGYSADEVLADQLGKEKVAVVFRWEDKVVLHPGRDGRLPAARSSAVYLTTWDNLFGLVERMATDPQWHAVQEEGRPLLRTKLRLGSAREALFLQSFPATGRQRIKSCSYAALRRVGGADWAYRSILERSLSANACFTGDGTSKRTFTGPGKRPPGFPEFLGPNRELTRLPEVAVIGLGTLHVSELPAGRSNSRHD
jgi:hypothetical protein